MDDMLLLDKYAREHSDDAFRQIVDYHLDWVYSVCLRLVRDRHLAEDVTQAVFIVLARKAPSLPRQRVLAPWLLRVCHYCAANALRKEAIRHEHERKAADMTRQNTDQCEDPTWNQIAPALDSAVQRLARSDRHVVLLRFYEGRTIREVGAAIGVSEEAAKKRVARAVQRLRDLLARQNAEVPPTTLSTLLITSVVSPAPAAIKTTLASAVASAPYLAPPSAASIIAKGAINMMAWAKARFAATILALVVGAAVVVSAAAVAGFGDPTPEKPTVLAPKNAADPQAQEALKLLDRHAQTQPKLTSFTMTFQSTDHSKGIVRGKEYDATTNTLTELITDGPRAKHIRKQWGYINPQEPNRSKAVAPYQYWMWDGTRFYQYGTNMIPGRKPRLMLHENMDSKGAAREMAGMHNRNFMRYSVAGNRYRVAGDVEADPMGVMLRSADRLALRPAKQNVGGIQCFVIDATIGTDKHTVWIDPEHDFHMARALSDMEWTAPMGKVTARNAMLVTRFEKIDGLWVPMAMEYTSSLNSPNDAYIQTTTLKCSSFRLNPDHKALASFLLNDVEEGSLLEIITHKPDEKSKVARGRWQNAQPAQMKDLPPIVPPGDPPN